MKLIYLASVPWCSFSQRPHELIRYFHSATGGDVLWVDPYPGRFPSLSDLLHRRPNAVDPNCSVPAWMTVVKTSALPLEPLPFSASVNCWFWRNAELTMSRFMEDSTVLGIGKPTTLALRVLARLHFSWSFYDAMDDNSAFYTGWSRQAMGNRERRLIKAVSTVLTSSSVLQNRLQYLAQDVRLVPNACAADRMAGIPGMPPSEPKLPIVIGYVGTIGGWFDWELVISMAKAHPGMIFRLFGPIYAPPRASLPPNISLEPPLAHAEALQAMARFDVGLIPFKKNALTSCVDPIKYYEYRALGLPVVSTAFGEMALRDTCEGVYLVNGTSDAALALVLNRALAYQANPDQTLQFRKDNSWKKRFDQAGIFKCG